MLCSRVLSYRKDMHDNTRQLQCLVSTNKRVPSVKPNRTAWLSPYTEGLYGSRTHRPHRLPAAATGTLQQASTKRFRKQQLLDGSVLALSTRLSGCTEGRPTRSRTGLSRCHFTRLLNFQLFPRSPRSC